MKRIGILSDTHSHWDNKFIKYFSDCDEIWHAGDIGNISILEKLEKIAPTYSVYGNIDDYTVRTVTKKELIRDIEGVKVAIIHIGGYPSKYDKNAIELIKNSKCNLFVCGHSHILKVMFDKKFNCLCINPGAAGIYGFHKQRTIIKIVLDNSKIKDLEVIELNS